MHVRRPSNRIAKISSILTSLLLVCAGRAYAVTSCAEMLHAQVEDVRITAADEIKPSPAWESPKTFGKTAMVNAPFCRVQGIIEKEIGFELWLPVNWNQRYLGSGNGGDAGFINYMTLARGVNEGFASASSNLGHVSTDPHWALGHPDRLVNFEWQAHHLMAVSSKKLIEIFYGSAPKYSYYSGCSGGGLGGMNEVQRYPADYNGVLAGASGYSMVGISARWLTDRLLTEKDPLSELKAEDWKKISEAAVKQCDSLDHVKDGVISDPGKCKFDIASTPGLTPKQIEHAKQVLGPLVGKDGREYFPALPPGASFHSFPEQARGSIPAKSFGEWTYQRSDWDPTTFDIAHDISMEEATLPGLRVFNTDLLPFDRVGGKLITYVGTVDPIVPMQANIEYYNGVVARFGKKETDSFFRLFLVQGMDHCSNGPGPDDFGQAYQLESPNRLDSHDNVLSALVDWVEKGVAPDIIVASKLKDGKVVSSRPICPYPQVSTWKGTGDWNDAGNWECKAPSKVPAPVSNK
jgi:feruloyl esterase